MTEDKAKLLRSLAIDRSTSAAPPTVQASSRRWLVIAGVVAGCAVVGFAAFAVSELRAPDRAPQVASQPVTQTQPPPTAQPQLAQSSSAGNLAASGYVVARRKATVAAEITGKVVEVFVDEGMAVTEGQVVAKLDSILAQKDFELAQS